MIALGCLLMSIFLIISWSDVIEVFMYVVNIGEGIDGKFAATLVWSFFSIFWLLLIFLVFEDLDRIKPISMIFLIIFILIGLPITIFFVIFGSCKKLLEK